MTTKTETRSIQIGREQHKVVRRYANDNDTSIKAVIEKLISELMADTQEQPLTE